MPEIEGTSSEDNLYGTTQTDLIKGYEGNDNLCDFSHRLTLSGSGEGFQFHN